MGMNAITHRWRHRVGRVAASGAVGLALVTAPLFQTPLMAQTFVSGSTGVDGPMPLCTPTPCTKTLALPPDGVFNFTTISVPAGVTVTFTRNVANTPVTLLATGDVTINGLIDVSGSNAVGGVPGQGGPGGFEGGAGGAGFGSSPNGTPGLGPGGGQGGDPLVGITNFLGSGSGGGFGTAGQANSASAPGGPPFGVHTLFPLIGGSGGGGGAGGPLSSGPAGGGGGGAILIASSGTITLNTTNFAQGIFSRGGVGTAKVVGAGSATVFSGCGAGGGIRLVANTITANGSLVDVRSLCGTGFDGGFGRVRLEAFQLLGSFNTAGITTVSQGLPGRARPDATSASVQIMSIGGVSVPAGAAATYFNVPDVTLTSGVPNPVTVALQATNVAVGTGIVVSVVTEGQTTRSSFTSTPLAGTLASSTATASVTLPPGTSVLTATATFVAP
jgi:hypothetical protein